MTWTERWPSQGCGAGLRSTHYSRILSEKPAIDWFEAVTENYMDTGGRPAAVLAEIRAHYPVALHGVSLSIGTNDPLDLEYLKKLKDLAERIEPFAVSDHLCWTGVDGENLHDLLPLPFTEEAMKHVVRRIERVQEFLGRPIVLENPSTYVTFRHSQVPEWEFLREVARRSGCGLLLDLNNVYVNSVNHRFDAFRYLEAIPPSMVAQFHLAGHTDKGAYLFDTHAAAVVPAVWKLYEKALRLYGRTSTLVEWDEAIPELERLCEEVRAAKAVYERARKEKPPEAPAVPLYFPDVPATPKPSLVETQREFKERVRARRARMEGVPLHPQGGSPGEERMSVYADGYVARLSEALAETYEAVRHLLGAEAFTELARLYLEAHPSKSYNLNDVGKEMPSFIGTTRFAGELPFLPDLAALELSVASAFHAFDTAPFDASVLGGLTEEDWEKMRIAFHPSVRVVGSAWPVLDLWNARKTPIAEMSVPLEGRPQNVLVYRREHQVYCEPIGKDQKELVRRLLGGDALGETCERVAEEAQTEDLPLEEWFSAWTGRGLIAGVVL